MQQTKRQTKFIIRVVLIFFLLILLVCWRILWTSRLADSVQHNNVRDCRLALSLGADVNSLAWNYPEHWSKEERWDHNLQRFFNKDPFFDENLEQLSMLMMACRNKNLALAHLLIAHGADINAVNDQGCSALCCSICYDCSDNLEVIRYLISRGARINAGNKYGITPLMLAAGCDLPTVALLVEHGADVNAHDRYLRTPLGNAIACDRSAVVDYLLQQGADLNTRDEQGYTPLIQAITQGSPKSIEVILNHSVGVPIFK